jgi:hypothetical protein
MIGWGPVPIRPLPIAPMHYSLPQAAHVLSEVNRVLAAPDPDDFKVRRVWGSMSYLRASVLASMLKNSIGTDVYSGPFKGMHLTPDVLQGAYAPVLLGTYENELHPAIERIASQPYKHILNIGCAYGYYSVGLALRLPQATVRAFDTNEVCQQRCRDMATLNGVQSRVIVSGEFRGEDFVKYANERTLVFMDIEGAEMQLLNPELYPALQKMDVVVELHDLYDGTISKTILERFAPSHETQFVRNKPKLFDFESIVGPEVYVEPSDMMLAAWENRAGPTPWGVMWAKNS